LRRAAAGGGGRLLPALQARAGSFEALLTDWTVTSSIPATSLAWNPRTSRKMRTATWRGGSTCRAGHEGQRDGFALLVAGLRPERHVGGALEEGVGKRLQPDGASRGLDQGGR